MRDCEGVLQNLTELANRCAFAELGRRDTSILTSFALQNVLQSMGVDAKVVRVTCGVFPEERKLVAAILGGDGNGTRRPAAGPGAWWGHVVVTAMDGKWLLDPTLDQANTPNWPKAIRVYPLVMKLPPAFWEQRPSHERLAWHKCGSTDVRYHLFRRQNGFANMPDARPSHWRPVAEQIMAHAVDIRLSAEVH
jgi:hypothetical protein